MASLTLLVVLQQLRVRVQAHGTENTNIPASLELHNKTCTVHLELGYEIGIGALCFMFGILGIILIRLIIYVCKKWKRRTHMYHLPNSRTFTQDEVSYQDSRPLRAYWTRAEDGYEPMNANRSAPSTGANFTRHYSLPRTPRRTSEDEVDCNPRIIQPASDEHVYLSPRPLPDSVCQRLNIQPMSRPTMPPPVPMTSLPALSAELTNTTNTSGKRETL